jgi:AcrR family transcriptional regulator
MKELILSTALRLAAKKGFRDVTRQDIATAAKVATGSVSYHFDTMRKLQAAMVAQAIADSNLLVFAQALAAQHPLALKASPELKKAAARSLGA